MLRALILAAGTLTAAILLISDTESGGATPGAAWNRLVKADGAVDLAGPRGDGSFALAAGGRLFLLDPASARKSGFARGRRGYESAAGEPYIALASGAGSAACPFREGDLFALEPRDDPAVIRVSRKGRARRFVSLSPRLRLRGITFDTAGSFDRRLLVVALHPDKSSTLFAIGCRGELERISREGPRVEGGIEVAPPGFGDFAGRLIAVDEASGRIYAFDASGSVTRVADSGLPAGRDIGVESVGFVPPDFGPDGLALLSDNGIRPEVGTDSVLAILGEDLAAVDARPGDLLVATERGAETIRIRCATSCEVARVASGPKTTHAEGHIEFFMP